MNARAVVLVYNMVMLRYRQEVNISISCVTCAWLGCDSDLRLNRGTDLW